MQRLLGPKPRPEGEGGRSPEPPRWGRQQPGRGTVSGTDVELSGAPRVRGGTPLLHPGPLQQHGEDPPAHPGKDALVLGTSSRAWRDPPVPTAGPGHTGPAAASRPVPGPQNARHGLATALRACSVCRHGHMDAQGPARLLPECPSQPCPSQGHLGVCTWPPQPPLACAPEPHSCHTRRPVIPGGLAVLSLIPHSFEANPSPTGSSKHSSPPRPLCLSLPRCHTPRQRRGTGSRSGRGGRGDLASDLALRLGVSVPWTALLPGCHRGPWPWALPDAHCPQV